MTDLLSPNTQAILMLTAPLIAGRGSPSADLLTLSEYKRLARFLRDRQRQPSDLLSPDADELLEACRQIVDVDRLRRLLQRGFLLSQAVERWQTRAIWVVSRADAKYPKRFKVRLKEEAPPVLYGCGDAAILDTGGLAVVGSRNIDDNLIRCTENIGRLTAAADRTLISGGARGVDQAAMRGALTAGGTTVGILADSLEQAAMNRNHRSYLMTDRLVLISPYDPLARFNVGHAMQRNKLIYALADAALVVNFEYQKGGTWTGAVEQLERLRFIPVYVRDDVKAGHGLESLRRMGALRWPSPTSTEAILEALAAHAPSQTAVVDGTQTTFDDVPGPVQDEARVLRDDREPASPSAPEVVTPSEQLFATVRAILEQMNDPRTDAEVAAELNVSKSQAKRWLERLVQEGLLDRLSKPTRYRSGTVPGRLL